MTKTRPELVGEFGMAASTHWLATASAMSVLERGGNAFDAAVAAGFVLHVAEPHMNGAGGDAPMLLRRAGRDEVEVLCGQGPAPAGATLAHYRAEGLDLVPATGLLAAVVPGATPAWLTLLRDHGTWPLADVLDYAIGYAERGVPVSAELSATIASVRSLFSDEWTSSAEVWLPDGAPPAAGGFHRQPQLAAFYRRLVGEAEAAGGGREAQLDAALAAWRSGFVAEAVDRFAPRTAVLDTSGERRRGVLCGADLAGWAPAYEAPVSFDYGRWRVAKCGPWSQGPVLLQQLALLAGCDVAGLDPLGAEFVHLVTECAKLAFADREAFYGDPAFTPVPLDTLLSPAYNDARRALVGADASTELRPGEAPGYGGKVDYAAAVARGAGRRRSRGAGEPTAGNGAGEPTAAGPLAGSAAPRVGDTCHLDVIDRWGNMVSATPSGGWLQSSPAVPGLGFALGTRGQMFWLEEGHPLSLGPGRRPRTTLTPSLALYDGAPRLCFGTPGGDQQDQWQLVMFLRHVHHGMDLQEAIDAPAFHSDHPISSFWPRGAFPARLVVESRFGSEVVDSLAARGHDVRTGPAWSEGRLSGASREERDGGQVVLRAAANPRGAQGYAAGR
ncbi:MAG: gamma-glutamyltransferase family protein [Acidimicrobiales bacterium]